MRESKATLQSMTMSVFNSYGDSLVEIVCRDAFDSTNIIQVSLSIYTANIEQILTVFLMLESIFLSVGTNTVV